MEYSGIILEPFFEIGKIFSIHYFEYMNDFVFEGESHNFWEFVCVDKGEVEITAGEKQILLKKGDIAFHEPNEFHSVQALGTNPPNLVVISFHSDSPSMDFFRKKILKIDEFERSLLANIIKETRSFFDCRLDDPYLKDITTKEPELLGAPQMVKLLLTHFLIHLSRRYRHPLPITRELDEPLTLSSSVSDNNKMIFDRVTSYMENHIHTQLSIDMICKDNLVSKTKLQDIFRKQTGMGIIDYFSKLKIETAKILIRRRDMNITEISNYLGYNSIHYFSRKFKQETSMSPSEYVSSIKAMAEK